MNFIWNLKVVIGKLDEVNLESDVPIENVRNILREYPVKHILFSDLDREQVIVWLEKYKLRHYFGAHIYYARNAEDAISSLLPLMNGSVNHLITNDVRDMTMLKRVNTVIVSHDPHMDHLFKGSGRFDFLIIRDVSSLRLLLETGFPR